MSLQTMEQQIAEKAIKISKKCNKDQARYYKRMPALIVSCGLLQTLAFIRTKNDKKIDGRRLVKDLLENISKPADKQNNMSNSVDKQKDKSESVDDFSGLLTDADTLRSATVEIMSLLQWINRFNDAKPKQDIKAENKQN